MEIILFVWIISLKYVSSGFGSLALSLIRVYRTPAGKRVKIVNPKSKCVNCHGRKIQAGKKYKSNVFLNLWDLNANYWREGASLFLKSRMYVPNILSYSDEDSGV